MNPELKHQIERIEKASPNGAVLMEKALLNTSKLSTKYVRDVTIPYLLYKIEKLNQQILEEKQTTNARIREYSQARKRTKDNRRMRTYKRDTRRAYLEADKMLFHKVKTASLYYTRYMGAISAFPIMLNWCKENKMSSDTLAILIILNHYEWFSVNDGLLYGFNEKLTRKCLSELIKLELAEDFRSKKISFVSSAKGKQLFKSFKNYFSKCTNELFENYLEIFDPTKGYLFFNKRHETLHGDKKDNTEQK